MFANKRTIIERSVFMLLGMAIGCFYAYYFKHEPQIWTGSFLNGFVLGGFTVFLCLLIWAKKAIEVFFYVEKTEETEESKWW